MLLRLKTARGQIDAVIKMIEEDRYCIDIANQLLAIQSLIKNANNEVLTNHLNHCVKNAINEGILKLDCNKTECLCKHLKRLF